MSDDAKYSEILPFGPQNLWHKCLVASMTAAVEADNKSVKQIHTMQEQFTMHINYSRKTQSTRQDVTAMASH